MWVRGLKYFWHLAPRVGGASVAPHVGAWIEIAVQHVNAQRRLASHPMWVRGLKLGQSAYAVPDRPSHPMWVRGLKSVRSMGRRTRSRGSHPMWVRGLKSYDKIERIKITASRTPCGCVD